MHLIEKKCSGVTKDRLTGFFVFFLLVWNDNNELTLCLLIEHTYT